MQAMFDAEITEIAGSASRALSRTVTTLGLGSERPAGDGRRAAPASPATCSAKTYPLQHPVVGDLLAVPVTGAYCFTMSNNCNGARLIPVRLASNGRSRLVVRREAWSDLLARDVVS